MVGKFDFPESPLVGQEYVAADDLVYVWTGKVWNTKPPVEGPGLGLRFVSKSGDTMRGPLILDDSSPTLDLLCAVPVHYVDALAAKAVAKAGDTMTGALHLPGALPLAGTEATHKNYVDQSIASQSLYQGPWAVATNVPDLDPAVALPLHTYSWVAQTVDKDVPEIAPPQLPGIGGMQIGAGDSIVWNDNTSVYDLIQAPASTAGFLPLVGGTMTGVLTIDGVTNPTMALNNPQGANNRIEGRKDGVVRWTLDLGGAAAENTSNAGSDFVIYRFVNDGSTYTRAMQINRADGFMSLTSGIGFGSFAQPAASLKDLSKHISLYGGAAGTFGFNITGSTLNYHVSTGSKHDFHVDGVNKLSVQGTTSYFNTGLSVSGQIVQTGSNHIRCAEVEGYGIRFMAGAHIYKRSGYGCVLRKHSGGTQWKIENNDGGGLVDIATASLTTFSDIGIALPELENDAELMPFAREDNEHKGFDVAKVLTLMLAKIRALECELAALKGTPR